MRIRAVSVDRFGPLVDRSLELPAGLTIVAGGNESGKSSWHAALYSGLCGMRRGRGKPRAEDVSFEYRHAPWSGEQWKLQIECELDDGRELQIAQDLQAKTASAVDLVTGEDLAKELLYEGAPDGSRLFGLDRKVFGRTAWVRQADVMAVRDEPEALQVLLQTATSSTEVTATDALRNIAEFRQIHIGIDRANAVRPLRLATERLATAVGDLEVAKRHHSEIRSIESRLVAFDEEILRLEQSRDRLQNAGRAFELRSVRSRISYLKDLQDEFSDGAPTAAAENHARYLRVIEALAQWKTLGEPEPIRDLIADQLESRLADLARERDAYTQRMAHVDASVALLRHRRSDPRKPSRPVAIALLVLGTAVAIFMWSPLLAGVVALCVGAVSLSRSRSASSSDIQIRIENLLNGFDLAEGSTQSCVSEFKQLVAAKSRELEAKAEKIETQLAEALRSEARRSQELARRYEIRESLSAAIVLIGASSQDDANHDVEVLAAWCDAHLKRARLLEARVEKWRHSRIELERTPLLELKTHADKLELLLGDYDGELIEISSEELRLAESEISRGRESRAKLAGQLSSRTPELTLPAAEVVLAEAERELVRVQRLDSTLNATAEILLEAEEAAYRTVAPRVQQRLGVLVAEASKDRYTRLTVSPEDLHIRIEVAPGEWRDAQQLSHGTAELVYLLLRIVLAEQLCVSSEQVPLLLDDVTVHFDDERTIDFLELLHKLSVDRQIVLFSQEAVVRAWARGSLNADHLVELGA